MGYSSEHHAQGTNSGTKVNKEEVHGSITQGPIQWSRWPTIFASNPKEDRESVSVKLVGDVKTKRKGLNPKFKQTLRGRS